MLRLRRTVEFDFWVLGGGVGGCGMNGGADWCVGRDGGSRLSICRNHPRQHGVTVESPSLKISFPL